MGLGRKEKVIPIGVAFFFSFFVRSRTRTHSRGTVRWTVSAISANTGGYHYFRHRRKCRSSPASAATKSQGFQNANFSAALWNSTLVIAHTKPRAKPIQTPKTPSCSCSFWDKKVMREFLRKKDMRKFLYFETTKAGAKAPALTVRHIGIGFITFQQLDLHCHISVTFHLL